jgi:hypothetical protein
MCVIVVCFCPVFYSLELISNSCSPHAALCNMVHVLIYWPPTYLQLTKIPAFMAFCTVRISELCNRDIIVTVRILVVFVECHQVFCACKFMVENIIDFETYRKLQGPLFCCLLHHSYMRNTLIHSKLLTCGYPNDQL